MQVTERQLLRARWCTQLLSHFIKPLKAYLKLECSLVYPRWPYNHMKANMGYTCSEERLFHFWEWPNVTAAVWRCQDYCFQFVRNTKKRKESAKSVQCDNGCAAKLRTRPQWHVEALNKQEECINGYSLLCQRYIMQPKTVLLVSFTFSIRLLEQLY